MSNAPTPVIRKPRRWSLVWLVPIVTLILGGWLTMREVQRSGPHITIQFADGSGIDADRTHVVYKGVEVGTVKKVSLDASMTSAEVEVEMERWAAPLAREGTKFWIVRPEVSLRGISGLGTIFSGPSIAVLPGNGPEAKKFRGVDGSPRDPKRPTRAYVLRAVDGGSLKANSPVYYRGLEVGFIDSMSLAPDARFVLVHVRILEPYFKLVHSGTRFWNASGIDVKLGLTGAKIETESLQTILGGGISFATPEDMGPEAPEGTEFDLDPRAKEEWEKWRPAIPLGPTPKAEKTPAPTPEEVMAGAKR